MFLRTAMRYYRLWIYTCNVVLLVSVLVFLAVSIGILSHPNLALVPTPAPYHPTLLYGYFALFLQAGVLQAIGCLGAIKLCQKLLNTYWLLLLSLLLCDLFVGFIWLVRFSHLTDGLLPYLETSLQGQYGRNERLTEAWDTLQMSRFCCGVNGPMDYYNVSSTTTLPNACCHHKVGKPSPEPYKNDQILYVVSQKRIRSNSELGRRVTKNSPRTNSKMNFVCDRSDETPYVKGCAPYISKWYKDATETLMIFGFCVITFVKLCFVGILRFEIQEMIQKIKVIRAENNATNEEMMGDSLDLRVTDPTNQTKNNGGGPNLLPNDLDEGNPVIPTSQLLIRHNHISSQVDGGDSDTNSYCALITDTPVRKASVDQSHQYKRKQNGNNNELTEMRDFRQTEI